MHTTRFRMIATIAVVTSALAACSSTTTPMGSLEPDLAPTAPLPSPSPEGPGRPDPVWTTDIGVESWSQGAYLDDVVVMGANDGILRALDSATGDVVWEVPTGGAVRGGIHVADDTAYVVSDDGLLYAITGDGSTSWTATISPQGAGRGTYDNYGSRPVSGDGVVYAATYAGDVAAVDVASGATLWTINIGSPVEAGLALANGRLHVSTMGGSHYALDAEDGAIVWDLPTAFPVTTTPAIMGDTVLVGSRSANLMARDEATGEKIWTVGFGGSWVQSGAVPIDDSSFVTGSSDYKAVRAFDLETGAGTWLTKVGGWTWAVPAVADDVVYASEIRLDYQLPWDTALWAFDAQTGEVLWTAAAGPALEWEPDGYGAYGAGAGPVVAGDFVIVAGLDGIVRAFAR